MSRSNGWFETGDARLASAPPVRILPAMSAEEIIRQIKAMSPAEQAEVAAFLRGMETSVVREDSGTAAGRAENFRKAADHVFTEYQELLHKLAQ